MPKKPVSKKKDWLKRQLVSQNKRDLLLRLVLRMNESLKKLV